MFSVSRSDAGVQIAVTEGTVAVWSTEASGEMTILEAGQFAFYSHGITSPVIGDAPDAIERSLSWRNGEIALQNDTVGKAIAQFNRYNAQQLLLADLSLAEEKLVGLFKIDRPSDFAAMLRLSLDLDMSVSPQQIRLSRKKNVGALTEIRSSSL